MTDEEPTSTDVVQDTDEDGEPPVIDTDAVMPEPNAEEVHP